MKRKKIRTGWLEYFNFSSRERKGTAFLSLIILLQIIFLYWIRNHEREMPGPDPAIVRAILALESSSKTPEIDTAQLKEFNPVPFDPNHLTPSIATAAGLSEKQAKVIQNYVSKGGVFRTKSDFKKMYCISEIQFAKLHPFLLLPDSFSYVRKIKPERKKIIVDINKADSIELMQVRGIGPAFASRIVKYREKLGGFISKEQLKEVYGIRDSLYNALLPFISLRDTIPFRFIHLNTDTVTELAAHPYIRWKLANVIVSYRKQHAFQMIEEVKAMPMVDEVSYSKLYQYLKPD